MRAKAAENGVAELICRLVGWRGDADLPGAWPPPYDWLASPNLTNDADGIAWTIRTYKLSRKQYEETRELVAELVADESFRSAVELVARGLLMSPQIDASGLEILREATDFRDEPEAAAA